MKKLIHQWSWIILLVFCIGGLFYPVLGLAAIVCMLAPVVVAFFRGRMWCGNFCPRGSFSDILLPGISRKAKIPSLLKSTGFKITFLTLMMSAFAVQLVLAWGNLPAVGAVFIRMVLITTLLTLFLGVIYSPRTWCAFCPMGTMAHYVSKVQAFRKNAQHVSFDRSKCISCKICTKNCPIGIDVASYKETGTVVHADCLKCSVCIDKCPKKALQLD